MKIHLLPLSVAIAVLVASGCKQKSRFAIDTGQYPQVEFQRLDRDLLSLDTACMASGVRTLYRNYPGFFPAYVANVLGMNPVAGGKQEVVADVPTTEIYGYSTDLRSMTGGSGEFSYVFARYEQAPSDVQEKEVAARAAENE